MAKKVKKLSKNAEIKKAEKAYVKHEIYDKIVAAAKETKGGMVRIKGRKVEAVLKDAKTHSKHDAKSAKSKPPGGTFGKSIL